MKYYILTKRGAILNEDDEAFFVSIRSATQFSSFEHADKFAKSIPAIRNHWYHIVCDAYPSGTTASTPEQS